MNDDASNPPVSLDAAVELTDHEREVYEWQMWIKGFGEAGQTRLKNASVMISRIGGVGGLVAYQLAAAGVGKLVLAHAGNIKPSDLNRQLLMTHGALGQSRIESARTRLSELNPRLEIVAVGENVSESNVSGLVRQCDLVVDCAPMFQERFVLNREAFLQGKPIVECAMYQMETQLTTMIPGQTPCLRCLVPEIPATWKRQFPVLGAVSGAVACLAATEAVKWITGIGTNLTGRMLCCDLGRMQFRSFEIQSRPECEVCGTGAVKPGV